MGLWYFFLFILKRGGAKKFNKGYKSSTIRIMKQIENL